MKKEKIDKYHLSLAGEYRVASELLRRGLNATVTFGHAKSADVVAYGANRRAVVIEAKASQHKGFVTGFYNKYKGPEEEHPDFWILAQVDIGPEDDFTDRFFILSHSELAAIQAERNREYLVKRGIVRAEQALTWQEHYGLTKELNGVDNVSLTDLEKFEDRWDRILKACNQ
jgi:hypothetical protein